MFRANDNQVVIGVAQDFLGDERWRANTLEARNRPGALPRAVHA
jgi:hypothetical protein